MLQFLKTKTIENSVWNQGMGTSLKMLTPFFIACAVFLTMLNAFSMDDIPDEDYGYIDVRTGAHMFYWFYGSTNSERPRNDLPIVLWLQGGPGAGGSGYGNFGEMGPVDANLEPRKVGAWTEKVNLLFLDNPVGAGYSYVDDTKYLTTNIDEISSDLMTAHKFLIDKYPFMKTLPYWIFSESYGGKMTAAFGVTLFEAISNGEIAMNFQGVTLGDSWISGISYVNTWADYVNAFSLVDDEQYTELTETANQCQDAVTTEKWTEATKLWGKMEDKVSNFTNHADFYNVLQFNLDKKLKSSKLMEMDFYDVLKYHHLDHIEGYLGGGINQTQIGQIMNHQVRDQLGIIPGNVTWGGQSGAVFKEQKGDFMKPVVNEVDKLLDYGVTVNIWNGQLDLICCTLGTLEWLQTLKWKYFEEWKTAEKVATFEDYHGSRDVAYFRKKFRNLSMYFIMKAGHMVPADNPIAALKGLCEVTDVTH